MGAGPHSGPLRLDRERWSTSASGTNTVNASTGTNSWSSSTASGQYYITTTQADSYYEAIFDGRTYNGILSIVIQYPSVGPEVQFSSGVQID